MFDRFKRSLLLRLLERQTPEKLLSRAERALPSVIRSAARRSAAYATLLEENGACSSNILEASDVTRAPILDKQSTFQRFPIEKLLAKDVATNRLASVLTSSGYGAVSFGFGLSDRQEQALTPSAIDLGLQNAFGVDHRDTLLINTLPMGVVFESRAACVSNVSVREDMAFAILRQAGPLFEQIILVVDPLFCKRFLDYAEERGYDLGGQRINMVIGEETFQESFRSYLRSRLNNASSESLPFLGSSMGVGELGLNLFFETPETVAFRRSVAEKNPWRHQPMVFCFNPLRSWVEVCDPDPDGVGDLLITMMDKRATVPLPRYKTGDRVRLLRPEDLQGIPASIADSMRSLPFPVLMLYGRDRDYLSTGWHLDDFKSLQYTKASLARELSGAFRVSRTSGGLSWHLQKAKRSEVDSAFIEAGLEELVSERRSAVGAEPLSELRVYDYRDFPYGMELDYERKFRYTG